MRSLTDAELKMLDEMALDFAARELKERKDECDRYPYASFYDDLLDKVSQIGFFSITLPEELEGAAKGVFALSLVLGDICRTDASLAGVIFTNSLAQEVMMRAGSLGLMSGAGASEGSYREALIAFPSFDDPVENLDLRAVRVDGGEYSLFGSIEYVVLGGVARHALLPATTDDAEGYSFFLTELSGSGVSVGEPVLSLGLHSCPAADVELIGAAGKLVGREGAGAEYFRDCADRMSIAAAAMSAGIMRGSFDEALEYAKERFQGGREIVDWSELRRILAEMGIAVSVADSLVTQACRSAEEEEPGWRLTACAIALHVQSMACDQTTDGIQVLGGNGYMEDYGQEKRFRDAKQVQALLGMVPIRKLEFIDRLIEGELA